MIRGSLAATKQMIWHASQNGTKDFARLATLPQFWNPTLVPPIPKGYVYDEESPLLIKAQNIEPHVDTWDTSGRPANNRSLFWLLKTRSHVHVGVHGQPAVKLLPNDYLIFDDSKEHWLMANHTWVGVIWKLCQETAADTGQLVDEAEELEMEDV
jgi:hypothetical protein